MSGSSSIVYLIPTYLSDGTKAVLPAYLMEAIKDCRAFFVENERSARRHLKAYWKEIVIDDYEWFLMDKHPSNAASETEKAFRQCLQSNKNVGIISEAGCPGIADPGQAFVSIAHALGASIKPLVGPSSILLALMASGMNGQQFQFVGYLPIETSQRLKAIRDLEQESLRKNCTQVFIETPYRNNQLLETLLKTCSPKTQLCIAVNLTADNENVRTHTISEWRSKVPDIHKQPAIFLIYSAK